MSIVIDFHTRKRIGEVIPDTPIVPWKPDPGFLRASKLECIDCGKSCDPGNRAYLLWDWATKEWRKQCLECHDRRT